MKTDFSNNKKTKFCYPHPPPQERKWESASVREMLWKKYHKALTKITVGSSKQNANERWAYKKVM